MPLLVLPTLAGQVDQDPEVLQQPSDSLAKMFIQNWRGLDFHLMRLKEICLALAEKAVVSVLIDQE